MRIPRIVLAAPSSGAGKTSIATGLIAALTARGLTVSPHKVARGHQLRIADRFPDDAAQPLGSGLRRHGQRPVTATRQRGQATDPASRVDRPTKPSSQRYCTR